MTLRSWLQTSGKEHAPVLLRYAMGIVFFWFGISQLTKPKDWVAYLPDFLGSTSYAQSIIIFNGIFEVSFALLLVLGLFTRVSAILLGLHLLAITFEVGYNEIGVRDFGLTLATFAIALFGPDKCSLDTKRQKSSK